MLMVVVTISAATGRATHQVGGQTITVELQTLALLAVANDSLWRLFFLDFHESFLRFNFLLFLLFSFSWLLRLLNRWRQLCCLVLFDLLDLGSPDHKRFTHEADVVEAFEGEIFRVARFSQHSSIRFLFDEILLRTLRSHFFVHVTLGEN